MDITTENLLITKLVEYLNDNKAEIGLPVDVFINEHDETGEAMWVQPNSGERKTQQYVGGSYRGFFPFTVCYQFTNTNTEDGRRAVLDLPFYRLAAYFEAQGDRIQLGDATVTVEMVTHPAISYVSEDGQTIEHQATFRLGYHHKRPVTPPKESEGKGDAVPV